jgi:hypothetical protein
MTSSGVLVTRNENEIVVDSSENALIDQKSKYMLSDLGTVSDRPNSVAERSVLNIPGTGLLTLVRMRILCTPFCN